MVQERLGWLASLSGLLQHGRSAFCYDCQRTRAFVLVESSVEIKRNSQKKVYQQQGCEGGAVLVETRDITDFLCLHLDSVYLDSVGSGYLLFAPTGVPLFQIDRVGSYSHKYTVMYKNAIFLKLFSGVVGGAICCGLDGLTGCQA